jgi:diguanylate cyclase (GGDEF)-like protein/PAS domain S-box-containing protein
MPGLRSVRARIIATFSLLMLLLIGISLVSVFRSGNDQAEQVDVDADAIQKASLTAAALSDIDAEFTLQLETLRAFPVTKDWSFAEAFRASIARVKADVDEARSLQSDPPNPQALATLDDIDRQLEEIELQGEGAFLFTEVDDAQQATAARSQVENTIASLRPVVAELIGEQQHQIEVALPATTTTGDGDLLLWALLGFAGLVFVVGGWSALALTRSILRPLASLQASARAIASGDVATRPEISGSAEFESLARDLDRMVVALLAKETAEAGIAKAEARYRQLADRTADLVFRVDIQKGLTYANPAWEKVTGFTLDELASGPEIVGRLVHPDHWQSFVALWKAMLSGNMPEGPVALKCLHKDGQTIWLTFSFLPVYDKDGRLVAVEGTARDTTMLSHLVKEVRQRDDQLRLFLNLSNAAATAIDFDETADRALKAVLELLPRAQAGFLMAHNRHRDLLEVHAVRGLDQKVMSKLVVKPGENLIGEAFRSGETQMYSSIEELTAAGGLGPESDELLKQATEESSVPQSIVCAPLGISERPFGCLVLVTFSEGSSFQASDLDLLQAAAAQVAPPLENALLRAETELRAITDGLTGLHNRAYFHQRLSEEIERAKRYDHGLVVMIADIDNFKSYNDAQGQAAGDKILRIAADSIRSQMRRSDIACRYSGDEFAAILMHADSTRAQIILERIGKSLANKLKQLNDPATANLSLSAGLACYPDDATTADDLVRLADISLYSAKLGDSKAAHKV